MERKQTQQSLIQKRVISSDDIKEIVLLLNEPPFQQNMSLVGLNELTTFDLGDLVFKIFKHLDSDISINAKQSQPADIIFQVTQFLRVLSYEYDDSPQWQNGLLNGDRKIIYPIYYFLLKNLSALKKRAYLAKFLVPIAVPEEYGGDPELKRLNDQLKQLQVNFQVAHEQYEAVESSSLNPSELKKDIQKLQQEKEQLNSRIGTMKSKHGAKPQMAPMLQATNLLRKEQEEQARTVDKIQSYRQQLENAQSQLMSLQQTLMDAKKSLSPQNSPEQMLQAVKNQVRKNRQIVKERMNVQYNERLKKLQQTEKMLSQPPITQNELMMLQNTMTGLRRTVAFMEEKLSKETSKDDKLAIYKGQAALVTKKKEQSQQLLKREEDDMSRLQNQIRKKQDHINKLKGTGFKKNKLQDYINQIKEKKIKYAKSKAEIEQIKWEVSNLQRTEKLLKQQKQRYEKSFGLVDGERVVADKSIDNASVEEVNRQIDKLMDQIKKKKASLGPKLEEKKKIANEYERVQNQYKTKKIGFQGTTSIIEDSIKEAQGKVAKLRNQVYGMDTKIQLNKLRNQLLELKVLRLTQQTENNKGNGKGFAGHKSYQQYVKNTVTSGQAQISELAIQRQKIAERHLPSMQQKKMFADLKKLLVCKLKAGRQSESSSKGQRIGTNVNVLQL